MRLSVSVTGCAKLHQSTPYRADKICTFGAKIKGGYRHILALRGCSVLVTYVLVCARRRSQPCCGNPTHSTDLPPLGFAELCGVDFPDSGKGGTLKA